MFGEGDGDTGSAQWLFTHSPILNDVGGVTLILQTCFQVLSIGEIVGLEDTTGGNPVDEHARPNVEPTRRTVPNSDHASGLLSNDERTRMRLVFDQAPGFMAILVGPSLTYDVVNKAYYQLVGHRDLVGRPVREALPELAGQGYFELLDEVASKKEPFVGHEMEVRFQRTPNSPLEQIFIDLLFQPILEPDGTFIGIFIQGHDVTGRVHAQKALNESNERWRVAVEGSRDGVWDWNVLTNEVIYSKRWKEILGYDESELQDRFSTWRELLHPEDRDVVLEKMNTAARDDVPFHVEYRLKCKDGSWKWVLSRGIVVARDDRTALRLAGTMSDISGKKESEEAIWRHASFDALTGLPNRRLFRDRLEQEIKNAERSRTSMAVMFIDLDRFKEVNDLLGHDAGDRLLKEASARLRSCIRASDTVARLGGDEFTVILPDLSDNAHLEQVAEKIIHFISLPFQVNGDAAYISASIGITVYPRDAKDAEELIRNADQAMYAAKNAGRSRLRFFTRAMQKDAQMRLRLARDLRSALSKRQLHAFFQPIVDLKTNSIVKAEALLRWEHPTRGWISPTLFIPLAEETGLIHSIGDWILGEAVAYSKKWTKHLGRPFEISVNRSPVEFMVGSSDFAWRHIFADGGLDGCGISVEITEGVLLNASSHVAETLLQFRDAGIHVALDDFGTGYSSMSYLLNLHIDYLKIDQSFVRDIVNNRGSQTIAETMIVMAHRLGMKVIAEGVENQEQAAFLREASCDFGQGYLFERPLPATKFEELLESGPIAVLQEAASTPKPRTSVHRRDDGSLVGI
ncbi:hypothetical protein NCCP691_39220 [Noviherbaspirillum aridicola]|uniref:PAS domain S-box-containing protein/diguanylate cyclase (GGDEF)-like protein n=1 Tax=Noviherbaspirillum aridicola TaxID=2849687 RepID=A0ABQ4Q9S5_9BURK|nr:hypothetical protein NCCP691_39220 [Noviherbaspirillum aridicola]